MAKPLAGDTQMAPLSQNLPCGAHKKIDLRLVYPFWGTVSSKGRHYPIFWRLPQIIQTVQLMAKDSNVVFAKSGSVGWLNLNPPFFAPSKSHRVKIPKFSTVPSSRWASKAFSKPPKRGGTCWSPGMSGRNAACHRSKSIHSWNWGMGIGANRLAPWSGNLLQ